MSRHQDSHPTTLAICGDPVIGKALALILQDGSYTARFLPESSLERIGSLEDVRLLLLTPQPSAQRRDHLLASLRNTPAAQEIPILELVTNFEGTRETMACPEAGRTVLWPCNREELRRRIEAALLLNP